MKKRNLVYLFVVCIFIYITVIIGVKSYPRQYLNVGRAPYALRNPSFNCDSFLNSLSGVSNLHISFLWDSFGEDNTCLLRLMNDPRLKTLEIFAINEVCHRNGYCAPGEFLYGFPGGPKVYNKMILNYNPALLEKIAQQMWNIRAFLDQHLQPGTHCMISPGLESNLSSAASGVINGMAANIFPMCSIVQCGGKKINNASYKESHGKNPAAKSPCIVNLDGTDISFPQRKSWSPNNIKVSKIPNFIRKYAPRCEVVYLWTQDDNCRYGPARIAPNLRDCTQGYSEINNLVAQEIIKAQIGY